MTQQPPRAYDVQSDDFDPEIGFRLAITLDGAPQKSVIAYDADAGWVRLHALDDAGHLIIDRGTVQTVQVTGTVEVTWRDALRETAQS